MLSCALRVIRVTYHQRLFHGVDGDSLVVAGAFWETAPVTLRV